MKEGTQFVQVGVLSFGLAFACVATPSPARAEGPSKAQPIPASPDDASQRAAPGGESQGAAAPGAASPGSATPDAVPSAAAPAPAPSQASPAVPSRAVPHARAPRPEAKPTEPVYYVDDEATAPLPFREGTRVPQGFRLDASPRYGLVVAGASTSGALWIVSTIAAISLDKRKPVDGDPNFADNYWPMFIPVIGPFITIGTASASGTGAGILALDGAFQAGGLALMVAGFAAPKLELVHQKGVYLDAQAGPGSGVLRLGGTF